LDVNQFNKADILTIFTKVGKKSRNQINVYLSGGGAMAIRGDKESTKDVDIILKSEEEALELVRIFEGLGYRTCIRYPTDCTALTDAIILGESRGIRIDIFVNSICRKLVLSDGIMDRSEEFGNLNNLSLSICSREDIFLSKSVTERT